jgi:hypothetical protein
MASLFDRVSRVVRSPQGQRALSQAVGRAQQLARDPANRARIEKLRTEVTRRVNGSRGPRRPEPPR